jgi:hypothetical protein
MNRIYVAAKMKRFPDFSLAHGSQLQWSNPQAWKELASQEFFPTLVQIHYTARCPAG